MARSRWLSIPRPGTSPANGTTITAPGSVTITASASDADGSVASVAFYANGSLLAQDFTAPYSYSWSGIPAGGYTLTAVATDNSGLQTTAAATLDRPSSMPALKRRTVAPTLRWTCCLSSGQTKAA